MTQLIELAPQVGIALAIVAAVFLMNRQVMSMVTALTKPDNNGGRKSRLEAIEDKLSHLPCKRHDKLFASNERAHRKLFVALSEVSKGQGEILEHITGSPSTTREQLPEDIDDMNTGRFDAVED